MTDTIARELLAKAIEDIGCAETSGIANEDEWAVSAAVLAITEARHLGFEECREASAKVAESRYCHQSVNSDSFHAGNAIAAAIRALKPGE